MMSMHVQIGDCTTPEAIPMLITLYYYYRGLLYWPRQKKLQEMDWEQWNNAARRRGQRAHTRRTDGKAHPHLAIGIDGTPQSRDAAEGSQCMMRRSVQGPDHLMIASVYQHHSAVAAAPCLSKFLEA
jgi:hypothetical protein